MSKHIHSQIIIRKPQEKFPRFLTSHEENQLSSVSLELWQPLPWQLIPKTYTVKSSISPAKDMKISGAFGNPRKHLPDDNRITTLSFTLLLRLCFSISCSHTCSNNKHKECLRHVHCVLGKACSSFRCMTHFLLLIQMCWIADSPIVENARADLLRTDSAFHKHLFINIHIISENYIDNIPIVILLCGILWRYLGVFHPNNIYFN